MKTTAVMIVLNEEDYLHYCLKSIYPVMDRIIIVEGAEAPMWFAATPEGLSKDKTPEIIESFPDEQKKITWIKKGRVDHQLELRAEYSRRIEPDTDIVMIIDGDEIWDAEELTEAFKYVMAHDEIGRLVMNHVMFFKDFQHIRYDPNPYEIVSWMGAINLFRFWPDIRNEGLVYARREGLVDALFHQAQCYHLGWMRQEARLIIKYLWTIKRHLHRKTGRFLELKDSTDEQITEYVKKWIPENNEANILRYVGKYPKVLLECIEDKYRLGWPQATKFMEDRKNV